jgi:single-stranded DNA-binding protein
MSRVEAKFTGTVVADPERKQTKNGIDKLEFPVYVNHSKKNKDSGTWHTTGDVTKFRVTLWGDKVDTDIRRGDLVEVVATIVEKEFQKRDGTQGRSLQTEYVEAITIKHRKTDSGLPALSVGHDDRFEDEAPF